MSDAITARLQLGRGRYGRISRGFRLAAQYLTFVWRGRNERQNRYSWRETGSRQCFLPHRRPSTGLCTLGASAAVNNCQPRRSLCLCGAPSFSSIKQSIWRSRRASQPMLLGTVLPADDYPPRLDRVGNSLRACRLWLTLRAPNAIQCRQHDEC